ncbi:hypothetical protein GCM10009078_11130 [Cupriavidus gilardii]
MLAGNGETVEALPERLAEAGFGTDTAGRNGIMPGSCCVGDRQRSVAGECEGDVGLMCSGLPRNAAPVPSGGPSKRTARDIGGLKSLSSVPCSQGTASLYRDGGRRSSRTNP